jgi:hypothetical protein
MMDAPEMAREGVRHAGCPIHDAASSRHEWVHSSKARTGISVGLHPMNKTQPQTLHGNLYSALPVFLRQTLKANGSNVGLIEGIAQATR